ncbi:hypothetical protein [Halovivax limisalsi]|uniref:hypothetical protein n=1 Tax=Halovivax limisalsi TaxID=1453760 RepID=UPI001FFCF0D1|nr:hypothetical protein [Halovivax limisalsi]
MTADKTDQSDGSGADASADFPTDESGADASADFPTDESGRQPGEEILGGTISDLAPSTTVEDADPPWLVELGGSIGVGLGVLALALAIVGVTAAWLGVQPLGNVAVAFALITIAISFVLGLVYQFSIMQW